MTNSLSQETKIPAPSASWTQEQIDFAVANAEKLTRSQIGKHIGKSKAAVANFLCRANIKMDEKLRRLRFQQSGRESRVRRDISMGYERIKSVSKKGERSNPQHMKEPPIGILGGEGVKLWMIEAHHCKWIVGEPKDLTCCGNERQKDSPYCSAHSHIAYTTPAEDRHGRQRV